MYAKLEGSDMMTNIKIKSNQRPHFPSKSYHPSESIEGKSFYINKLKNKFSNNFFFKLPKSVLTLLLCKCPMKCHSTSCGSCRHVQNQIIRNFHSQHKGTQQSSIYILNPKYQLKYEKGKK